MSAAEEGVVRRRCVVPASPLMEATVVVMTP
jgi:hypothetical protein